MSKVLLEHVPSSLIVWELVFAMTSLVYEAYIVLGVDLAARPRWDVIATSWYWYATKFDPVFLNAPPLLRLMCGLDFTLFGPFHLVAAYALHNRQAWIRLPALVVNSMLGTVAALYPGRQHSHSRGHSACCTRRCRAGVP